MFDRNQEGSEWRRPRNVDSRACPSRYGDSFQVESLNLYSVGHRARSDLYPIRSCFSVTGHLLCTIYRYISHVQMQSFAGNGKADILISAMLLVKNRGCRICVLLPRHRTSSHILNQNQQEEATVRTATTEVAGRYQKLNAHRGLCSECTAGTSAGLNYHGPYMLEHLWRSLMLYLPLSFKLQSTPRPQTRSPFLWGHSHVLDAEDKIIVPIM